MKSLKFILSLLLVTITIAFSTQADASESGNDSDDESNLVKVSITEDSKSLYDKSINYLVFNFKIADHWHIYWQNPGDSGLATEIELEGPEGVKIGDILWQVPEKIPFDDLANYGYSNSVDLIIPVEIADDYKGKSVKFTAEIKWLVCKEKCLGQDTSFSFRAEISDKKEKIVNLENYKYDKLKVQAYSDLDAGIVEIKFNEANKNFEFFPFEGGYFKTMGQTQTNSTNGSKIILELEEYRFEDPKKVEGLLISEDKVFEISADIKSK